MSERPEPERIEVELTSTELGRAPAAPPPGSSAVVSTPGPSRSPLFESERGRLLAATTLVGVVALVAGLGIGRAGGGEESTDDPVATTTPPTPTTTESGLEVLPPVGPTTTLPTSGSRSVLPTTPGNGVVYGIVDIAPLVAGIPIEIIALTSNGDLLQVNAATGRMQRRHVEGSQFGPPTVLAGAGWVLVPSFDPGRDSLVVLDDGTTSTVDVGYSWPMLAVSGTDLFWRAVEPAAQGGGTLEEVSVFEGPTGRVLDVPGYPQYVDPLTSGIIIKAPGGAYTVTPEGTQRMTDGRLLAAGRSRAFVEECDEVLQCGYFVVDRVTGDRAPLTIGGDLDDRATLESSGWWTFQDPMSPNEDQLMVVSLNQVGNSSPSNGLLDLDTGDYVQITEAIESPLMEWGPSGELVFWLNSGELEVYDLRTGESTVVSADIGQLNAFTWRAALPSVDGSATSTVPDPSLPTGTSVPTSTG